MRKLFAAFLLVCSLVLPARAFASTLLAIDASTTGLNTTAEGAFGVNWTSAANNKSLASFVGFYIIQPVFGIVGLLFFVLMVYAGVLWMTARGDSKQVDKAKDILTTSVIGAVIVVSSYVLTTAVFNAITSGNVNGA
jgi:uncharacterized membrane protein